MFRRINQKNHCELKPIWFQSHHRILVGGWSWKRKKRQLKDGETFAESFTGKELTSWAVTTRHLQTGAEEGTLVKRTDEVWQRTLSECYSQWIRRQDCPSFLPWAAPFVRDLPAPLSYLYLQTKEEEAVRHRASLLQGKLWDSDF